MPLIRKSLAWVALWVVLAAGLLGVALMAHRTHQEAPPMPSFLAPNGTVLISAGEVVAGQLRFQALGLMNHGSMFGDGAGRGPDYTAEALHVVAVAMVDHHASDPEAGQGDLARLAHARAATQAELKANRHDPSTNSVRLTAAQVAGHAALVRHMEPLFARTGLKGPGGRPYVAEAKDRRALAAFFFWGAWVCAAERPGQSSSYTHNWPHDELAGNRPSPAVTLWSALGILGLVAGLGLVLYLRGILDAQMPNEEEDFQAKAFGASALAQVRLSEAQRATAPFFILATALFGLQVLAGVLTVHDFLGFTRFGGVDLAEWLPITVVRSWHLQWGLMWIVACWMGASLFVMPWLTRHEPIGQATGIRLLFAAVLLVVLGSSVGIYLGPLGHLGPWWHLLGNQGWEFVELGKLFQWLLWAGLAFWCWLLFRHLAPRWYRWEPDALEAWLAYTVLAVLLLFGAGFVARPETNFVVADFWRWCVIHMWVESFLEVFTTIIVGAFMWVMGLVSRRQVVQVVAISSLLFLGSGILGISHNFYWNAKPVEMMALGSIFSTLQVVPLILLALEAWKTRQLPQQAAAGGEGFALRGAFLFLLGVNFWNFYGAGVLGMLINLPIVNYYEHGTYLTVNHGHAAFMGVYGNLSIAALLFTGRFLLPLEAWREAWVDRIFWSLNLGLMLMVLLDLFPVGVLQFQAVLEGGLWYARSQDFVGSGAFQGLTWARAIGGYLFSLGGVIPLFAWLGLGLWRARAWRPERRPQP